MSPRAGNQAVAGTKHWPSIIQFSGSSLGLVLFWTGALSTAILGLYQLLQEPEGNIGIDMFLASAGLFWAGALMLPSVTNSLARVIGRPVLPFHFKKPNDLIVNLLLLGIFFAALIAGHLSTLAQGWFFLGMPPIHIIAASIPLGMLMWLAIRKLDLGSAQRRWGALASGLTLAVGLAILFELLVGLILILIGILYVSLNPELSRSLETIQNLEVLPPALLEDPVIILLLLANFSLAVPLIEELTKPIAVWLLMWRKPLTPAAGFGLGLLSGAGFALMENLLSGASVDHWAGTTTVRIGATAFHMATSALMGWALVRAKNEGRVFALLGVYLFNIVIHGIWNGVVIVFSLASLDTNAIPAFLPFNIPVAAGAVLLLISLISVTILARMNHRLQPLAVAKTSIKKNTSPSAKPKPRS